MVSISKEVHTPQYCLGKCTNKKIPIFNTGFHIYLIGGFQKYEHNLNLTMAFRGQRQILPDWPNWLPYFAGCRGR